MIEYDEIIYDEDYWDLLDDYCWQNPQGRRRRQMERRLEWYWDQELIRMSMRRLFT